MNNYYIYIFFFNIEFFLYLFTKKKVIFSFCINEKNLVFYQLPEVKRKKSKF